MITVIGKILRESNRRIEKYIMFDNATNKTTLLAPYEVEDAINNGVKVVGLKKGGTTVLPSKYFSHIGVLGNEGSETEDCKNAEYYTIVRQLIFKNTRKYEVADLMGNTVTWERDHLLEMLKDHHVNGVRLVHDQLHFSRDIEIIIPTN